MPPLVALHELILAKFWWCDRQGVNHAGVACLQECSWFILIEGLVPARLDVCESSSQSEIQR